MEKKKRRNFTCQHTFNFIMCIHFSYVIYPKDVHCLCRLTVYLLDCLAYATQICYPENYLSGYNLCCAFLKLLITKKIDN